MRSLCLLLTLALLFTGIVADIEYPPGGYEQHIVKTTRSSSYDDIPAGYTMPDPMITQSSAIPRWLGGLMLILAVIAVLCFLLLWVQGRRPPHQVHSTPENQRLLADHGPQPGEEPGAGRPHNE